MMKRKTNISYTSDVEVFHYLYVSYYLSAIQNKFIGYSKILILYTDGKVNFKCR